MKRWGIACFVGWLSAVSAYAADVQPNEARTDFNQPRNLAELLALPLDQLDMVDIARINLLCAEGLRGSENLNVEQCLADLENLAKHVERETKRNFHHFTERPQEFNNSIAYYQMGMLGTVLAEDLRMRYNPELEQRFQQRRPNESQSWDEWKTFFSSSKDVFLHGLLTADRVGTCASMPFLYVAIGRRLGYPVVIAARKHHLYARYDAPNGEHLNVEATENRGFATPSDEEYRQGPFPMTQEEIDGMDWLRPLTNKEIFGTCLAIRASCLRSMKRYTEEMTAWEHAARYLPDTALAKRVIQKNQELAKNIHAVDRCNELWDEVEKLYLPTGGPRAEYFQNRKWQVQFFMKQSDDLGAIESSVNGLKQELRRYRNEISDNPSEVAEAYDQPRQTGDQAKFLALLQDSLQPRRLRIPQEKVPYEYWTGIPLELLLRLERLTSEQEVIEEMHTYSSEEAYLRNVEARIARNHIGYPSVVLPPVGGRLQDYIHPEDLPWAWRNKPLPSELQDRLARLHYIDSNARRMEVEREVRDYESAQYERQNAQRTVHARRMALDHQPTRGSPLRIEIIPATVQTTGQISPSIPEARIGESNKP